MASPALVRLAAERFSSCCTRQYQFDGVLEYQRSFGASLGTYFVRIPYSLLDTIDVPASHAFDLAAKFEVAANLVVVEDAKAVYD